MRLDDAVRDAVRNLADEARPVNLGARAVTVARRRRAVRAAVATIAAIVALAAAAATVVVHPWRDPVQPAHRPSVVRLTLSRDAPLVIEGLELTSYHRNNGPTRVLLTGGRYVEATVSDAAVAPAGDRVAAIRLRSVGLLDPATDTLPQPWQLPWGHASSVQWSPDGSQVLMSVEDAPNGSPTRVGFAIVDVATGKVQVHRIDMTSYLGYYDEVSWHPAGDRVVLPIVLPGGAGPVPSVAALQLFDLSGAPAGALPVPALVHGPQDWSPDAHHIVGFDVRGGGLLLFDGPPWRQVGDVSSDDDVWWVDDNRLLVARRDRAGGALLLEVRDRAGRLQGSYRIEGPDVSTMNHLTFRHIR